MKERKGAVTFQGNPLTLLGDEVKIGDRAPDVEFLDDSLNAKKLSSFKGKVSIIISVPSLDTPVCDMEARRFNQEAGKLGKDVNVIAVSMDLPFAQKRWCAAAGVEWVKTFSDYRDAQFGNKFGVLIKELRLLARSVFIVDREGIIRYVQHVKEIAKEPDYAAVLNAAKTLV